MKTKPILPVWAARLKPYLLRRLYEADAQGICDEELINEVGWKLHARCESFLQAMEAQQGRTRCPVCAALVNHSLRTMTVLRCPNCGWECVWRDYAATITNQQLAGGPEVVALFQEYADAFPKAKEPTDKMLLIDQLIHGFHHYLTSKRTRRPVGVNLIDGSLTHVIEFLDQLTYGPGSTPGLPETHAAWHANAFRVSDSNKKHNVG